jgi:hypothetical protein
MVVHGQSKNMRCVRVYVCVCVCVRVRACARICVYTILACHNIGYEEY